MLVLIGFVANYLAMQSNGLQYHFVWIAIPFVCFGVRKGENDYYDSDNYNGNGTAH